MASTTDSTVVFEGDDFKGDMKRRYQHAQKLAQGYGTQNLVQNDSLYPHWIAESDCFWYERATRLDSKKATSVGKEYRLVNAKTPSNTPAFDHRVFANSLSLAADQNIDPNNLPITNVAIDLSPLSVDTVSLSFSALGQRWIYSSDDG